MSSVQETHILPPPKPKLSPLELRNADLVSRLLAATPPYLYNMSLLPNSFFFSEMLRSFVQAKNEQNTQRVGLTSGFAGNSNMYFSHSLKRPKKRGWNSITRENFAQNSALNESKIPRSNDKTEIDEPWMIKSMRKTENDVGSDIASETTNIRKADHDESKSSIQEDQMPSFSRNESTSNLVLPPPPPIWYPPIYPTPPYGIDPLHFFIDLRVSGHIYDRQNNNTIKDGSSSHTATSNDDSAIISGQKTDDLNEHEQKNIKVEENLVDIFGQKRHCSAFSVPTFTKNSKHLNEKSQKRFDVKSLGFDKSANKTGTNYVLRNIIDIYKNVKETKRNFNKTNYFTESTEQICEVTDNLREGFNKSNSSFSIPNGKTGKDLKINNIEENLNETNSEKEKKVKNLRALIGLELVVDYMSHKKEGKVHSNDSSFSEGEIEVSGSEIDSVGSPQVEVVAVQDDV